MTWLLQDSAAADTGGSAMLDFLLYLGTANYNYLPSLNLRSVAVSARGSLLLPKVFALLQLLVQLPFRCVLQDKEYPLLHMQGSV